jgi:O-antigen biosynthesis protein
MNKKEMLFDQFSRYNGLNKILNLLSFDEKTTLLDIGSGPECLMGSVVDSTNITFLDPLITKEESRHIIKGNIFSEKLNNRKFDFVTAIDVLEHIPFAIRNSFIERLSELTENCIILAFPTSENRSSTQIDESVNENYKKVYGIDYPWLDEHFTYTLPSIVKTKAKFEDLGWKCSTIGHGYAPWLEEMMNIVIPTWDCLELHDVLLEMSKTFNESFAEYDFNAPYYREFLIVSKHQLPELSSLVKNIDNEVEVKYQNLVRDTREVLFAKSLTTIAKKDKNIQELNKNIQDVSEHILAQKEEIEKRDTNVLQINHLLEKKQNELMELSDWATTIKEQLDNNSKELESIKRNLWYRILKKCGLI